MITMHARPRQTDKQNSIPAAQRFVLMNALHAKNLKTCCVSMPLTMLHIKIQPLSMKVVGALSLGEFGC